MFLNSCRKESADSSGRNFALSGKFLWINIEMLCRDFFIRKCEFQNKQLHLLTKEYIIHYA